MKTKRDTKKKKSFTGVLQYSSPKTIRASPGNVTSYSFVKTDSTRLPGALRDLHKKFELSLPLVSYSERDYSKFLVKQPVLRHILPLREPIFLQIHGC